MNYQMLFPIMNFVLEFLGILVANKIDLKQRRVVTMKQGSEFAESHGLEYVETSAVSNLTIFSEIACVVAHKGEMHKWLKCASDYWGLKGGCSHIVSILCWFLPISLSSIVSFSLETE